MQHGVRYNSVIYPKIPASGIYSLSFPSKILYLFFSPQMSHFLCILSPHPCSPIPLVHAASSGYLLPVIFNIISTLSVRDNTAQGFSSSYRSIPTTPTRRSRSNHLSNLSAAKLVAKWMTLQFR